MIPSDDKAYSTEDITGIIMPHNWDDNGQVTQIAIYTNKEEVYLVGHNQNEKKLLKHIHKRVAVKGKILRGNDGNQFIDVKNFIVQAKDADDENDIK